MGMLRLCLPTSSDQGEISPGVRNLAAVDAAKNVPNTFP